MSGSRRLPEGNDMIRTGRKIAITLLPALTLVSGVLLSLNVEYRWLDWLFRICLSGTVGIWTNYFAIRMLFRPCRRTVFGRQGLIPAKREELADAIASAVSEELLDTDSILRYVQENELVEKAADGALELVHRWIDDPVNRTRVISAVAGYVQERGSEQVGHLLSKGVELLRKHAVENLSTETVWAFIRDSVERELEKPGTLELMTMVVTRLVEENASAIADSVNSMLEDWIDSQKFLVKNAMKLGKGIFGIDSGRIRSELLTRIRRPSFVRNVMNVLEENISSLTGMGEDPSVRERFSAFLEEQKERLYQWARTEGEAGLRKKLFDFMGSETFWEWIERQVDSIISLLKEYASGKVRSEEFRTKAGEFLIEHMNMIEIRDIVRGRVNEFDLEQLEKLVNRVSGENLCGIELFGGILGMLAGLILIDQRFVVAIPLALSLIWLLERFLGRNM